MNKKSDIKEIERTRNFCATIFDKVELDRLLNHDNVNYVIYGNEICPTTGKNHYQTFFQLKDRRVFKYVKKEILYTSHFELCKGTEKQNSIYCSKDKDYKEFGTLCVQGKHTDTKISDKKDILQDIKDGKSII
jgi:hypothetical protein